MSTPSPLAGTARWLTGPSTLGGVTAAALAVSYGIASLDFPKGTLGPFLIAAVVVVVAMTVLGDWYEQSGLPTVRALGAGEKPLSRPLLRAAVREVFEMPGRSLRANLIPWSMGALLLGLFQRLVPHSPIGLSFRIAFLGISLAPLPSFIAYFLVVERSRAAVEKIAALGLAPTEVARASGAGERKIRRRLMLFIGGSVACPALLVTDLIMARADRALEAIENAPTVSQRLELAQSRPIGPIEIALAVAVCSSAIATAFLYGSSLRRPLRRIAEAARHLADGELAAANVIPAEDEVWLASAAFAAMHARLSEALSGLGTAGDRVGDGSGNLVEAFVAQTIGADEQATALNETSATTEELARSAAQISGNAAEVEQIAERTVRAAQAGQKSSEIFFQSMVQMREGNQRIADSVVRLNKRVAQIGRVIEFINGVGDKSDLLALNAELEGTKAGDVGRGFSLVAAEMRRLAETVLRSTSEIVTLISEIRDGTHAAVMATESGVKAMDAGTSRASEVLVSLKAIVSQSEQTREAIRTISIATQQQRSSTDQLAMAMGDILRITTEGQEGTQLMAGANEDLARLARDLKTVVERFHLAAPPTAVSAEVARA